MPGSTASLRPAELTDRLLFCIALGVGVAVANLYYSQPMLGLIAREFGQPGNAALIATCTQAGYAAGLLLLVPLGDRMERRQLIVTQSGFLILALSACAVAPTFKTLAVASFFVGVFATIAQQLIPLAADLARDSRRDRAVGVVFAGSLVGILFARCVSGLVSEFSSWRTMFCIAAAMTTLVALLLWVMLPPMPSRSSLPYRRLLASLFDVFSSHRALRKACAIQACIFGAASAFWSVFALMLQQPPLALGPAVAGSFGLIGIAGVTAVAVRARIGKQRGVWLGVGAGGLICAAAFVMLGIVPGLAGLAVGILLLDVGVALCQVSGQSAVLALDVAARSRINTLFITSSFLGGAAGSAAASYAWRSSGWEAVLAVGLGFTCAGLAVHLRK